MHRIRFQFDCKADFECLNALFYVSASGKIDEVALN